MGTRPRSGDEQDVRREVEQPGERDLSRCCVQPCPQRGQHRGGEQVPAHVAGPAQGRERDEGDLPAGALGEHVRGSLVGQVEEVLHADDLRLADGAQQLRPGDVAEADTVDQPFLTGPDQRRQLSVEPLPGDGRVHDPQVHGGQPADAEGGEIVLDPLPKLVRLVPAQHRAASVPAGAHLAHDRQPVRVGEQRGADQLVHRAQPVELRGVDVVHPGLDRRAQDPQCLGYVGRWPEDAVAGELHRAVPSPAGPPPADREGPAELLHQACTCEPSPRSRRIASSSTNAVLAV